jgi:RNA polymerase sigma-70 factor (ECF subfamily)
MENSFTEQQLLSMMADNDRKAFEIIYRRYWNDLYNAAYRRLKNAEQVEDIVQDIFIRFWERRATLQIENLSAYLHTAVRYKVYNYISRDAVTDAFYEPFEAIAVYPVSADAMIIEKELLQLTEDYFATLPKKRQRIFSLYFNEELSTREIAARLNISQKTVQNQLCTTMNGLRAHILPVIIFFVLLLSIMNT